MSCRDSRGAKIKKSRAAVEEEEEEEEAAAGVESHDSGRDVRPSVHGVAFHTKSTIRMN